MTKPRSIEWQMTMEVLTMPYTFYSGAPGRVWSAFCVWCMERGQKR